MLCVLLCFTHMAHSLKSRSICCPPVYTRHVFLRDGRQALLISCCPCRTCAGDHTTPCTSPLLRLILHRSSGLVINSSASLSLPCLCVSSRLFSLTNQLTAACYVTFCVGSARLEPPLKRVRKIVTGPGSPSENTNKACRAEPLRKCAGEKGHNKHL